MTPARTATTVDPAEAARFAAMADSWWDPHGQFRPLHRLNPTRIAYIRDRVAAHFGRDPLAPGPLAGLRLLDIGCGGGLLSEPMARLGAAVVGVDVAERNIHVARLHAARVGLDIDYRAGTAEALAEAGERFDVVLNMEVIEHVAHVDLFVAACAEMVRPGGATVLATLNRTLKSLALAKFGAEYVLRWLPRGTHDWRRFMHPHEVAAHMRRHGLAVGHVAGMSYDPFADEWRLSRDLSVNYLMFAAKAAE